MENTLDKEMNTFSIVRKKGIDDLLGLFAFVGNSQGDESVTNSVEEYLSSKGWKSFVFADIDPTDQEAIYAEVERRRLKNEAYIKELQEKGEFGREYTLTVHVKPNPIFDHSPSKVTLPMESYRMVFIDDKEFNGEPNIQKVE